MKVRLLFFVGAEVIFWTLILFPMTSMAGELEFVPIIGIAAEYDDNISFSSDSDDAEDDFAVSGRPGFSLKYTTELLRFNSLAEVDVKRYFNQTDFDRINQLYQVGAEYQALQRWTLFANGEFREDKTTDAQFEETGRVFRRTTRNRYKAEGGVRYNLTELTDIGAKGTYEITDFSSSQDDDYNRYTVEVPYRKRFKNQIDTIQFIPAYSRYNSDEGDEAIDYRLTFTWIHLLSETLTSWISFGSRYTDTEDGETGDNNANWGGIGSIGLRKTGETFSGRAWYSRDLRSNTEGELIEVDRVSVNVDKLATERFGFKFDSSFYHSTKESQDQSNDRVISIELTPAAYYMLTPNHSLELSYRYRREIEMGEEGNPTTNQNRVILALILKFPRKWD